MINFTGHSYMHAVGLSLILVITKMCLFQYFLWPTKSAVWPANLQSSWPFDQLSKIIIFKLCLYLYEKEIGA